MAGRNNRSFRSSILLEILVSLGAILVISVGATSLLEARLAGNALTRQSQELAAGRLSVLAEGYRGRDRFLNINLRNIAERLDANELTAPERRNQLIAELGRTSQSLQMDLLQTVTADSTQFAATSTMVDPSQVEQVRTISRTGRSGLIRTTSGQIVQALAVPIGVTDHLLVGGQFFSDPFAYEMRTAIGENGQTILVANGKVVGSTVSEFAGKIPGRSPGSDELPAAPVSIEFRGEPSKVAYISVGQAKPTTANALGVIFVDPVTSLNRSLSSVRLVSSLMLTLIAFTAGWVLFKRVIRPLVGLSETAGRIAGGDFDASFSAPRKDEIGRLAASLQQMTVEMQAKTRRLQEASKRLVGAQERERRRVARDLHDGMQQQLVALAIKLRRASGGAATVDHNSLEVLADDAENAAFALQELGRGISPTVLADQGLNAALRAAAGRLPMQVVLEVAPGLQDARFGPDVEGTLYYVALEAMTNAQKHAPESSVTVSLAVVGNDIQLKISDDGPGFDVVRAQTGHSAGLQNMQDRVSAQGGNYRMSSTIGVGSTILSTIPQLAGGSAGGRTLSQVDKDGGDPTVEVGLL